ncbi:hypothetical protein [Deinococcus soli (ex Cha et al. 2016)]|uniref:Uncharacterized protein n=2 Tax=Deinococcus soli (ex Cha et al. 2016) TaxID=1309411 RepID=A0ACC6KGX2_9DEIO|nr:hypothetical protein [Deinococcus soli (ex Cha et al. 2016)]MDR6218980.1 hypothetical protein [Deinococcus soli (ex Cha et al. 2016)]MDR6328777.1 hypothetical protein [Deinococcus soli (ex Cha et al. 2016)]MDR6751736.1 hypothetical protein [Deinococcus soli (ex Cha et al. 2016)]
MIAWLITCAALIVAALQVRQRLTLQAQLRSRPAAPTESAEALTEELDVTSDDLHATLTQLHAALSDLRRTGETYHKALINATELLGGAEDFRLAVMDLPISTLSGLPLRLRFSTDGEYRAVLDELGELLHDDPEQYDDPAAAAQTYARHLIQYSMLLLAEPQHHHGRVVAQMLSAARDSTRAEHVPHPAPGAAPSAPAAPPATYEYL